MCMVDVWLPYGKTEVCVRVPTRNFLGSIEPKEKEGVPDAVLEIKRALNEPIGSKRLDEIVKPEDKVAIVVDDATRPAPSHLMVPPLLEELNNAGVKDENITIIFACGTHKAVTHEEAVKLLGEAVLNRVKTVSHDCKASNLVYVGETRKHGTKVYLNHVFAEADVKILTGDIGFHYYAGYGGGRKSVLPGVSGEETIKHNHAMLLHPNAKTGVLDGNPVHEDMVEAARLAKVDFILNVVINSEKEVVKAFAGDVEQAFHEGVKLVDEMYRIPVDRKADIVVVSPGGYPADVNLFQAYKGVDNALEIVKRGGVIILVAECPEGHGNQVFYDWMVKFKDLKAVQREIKRNFVLGGHKAYYLMKALRKAQIFLVSAMPDYYATNIFKLKTARAVNDALNEAFSIVGKNAKVWVMPYGNFTLPEFKTGEE
ncbi:nickel-dependent lactate racemase [Candidatus Bathyarchaeota archaeon]|nr:MAG: nickel-dependent lactate racemase [Candidatus Bathyarchaeota archaeon]RLI18113.1 MAG: nickel-dependent lactate racemase [Candidatus Bathyarchaeota archaeon]